MSFPSREDLTTLLRRHFEPAELTAIENLRRKLDRLWSAEDEQERTLLAEQVEECCQVAIAAGFSVRELYAWTAGVYSHDGQGTVVTRRRLDS